MITAADPEAVSAGLKGSKFHEVQHSVQSRKRTAVEPVEESDYDVQDTKKEHKTTILGIRSTLSVQKAVCAMYSTRGETFVNQERVGL
jgi:hypothetical protein